MAQISKDGFWGNIEGAAGRIQISAKFQGSELNLNASIDLAKQIVGLLPMVAMMVKTPAYRQAFDEAKTLLLAEIKKAGG